MTQSTSSIAALIAPLIGRIVISTDKTGAESRYTISKLSDKLGTMKNGEKAEYVVLQSDADAAVVINLHPNTAKKIASKGEGDGFTLFMDLFQVNQPAAVIAPDAVPATQVKAEKVKATKVKAEKVTPVAEAKAPSKKDQFMAVYTANVGKTRQEIKTAADALGLSLAGFNTYYQNAKSGKWA